MLGCGQGRADSPPPSLPLPLPLLLPLSMRYFDQAAVFLESCLEYGLIKRNDDTGDTPSDKMNPHLSSLSLSLSPFLQLP